MNARKVTVSALVVAHNEEENLAACLDTLSFADEIVVVLDKCTDGSRDIAARYTGRLIEGSWEIEGPRRHAGIDACAMDWILEVDADERVSPELGGEILDKIQTAPFGHFLIPYDNYVGERLVRYGWGGSWGVSATVRLFARGAKVWGQQRIHPGVGLKGERMWLEHRMVHLVDRNISDMIQRLDRYTTSRARDMRAKGDIGSFPNNLRRLFSRFFKCYIGRKGYKEGYYGFLIALMAGLFPLLSHLKARLEND
ncbi:MAG: glycosyltransferase family 2 protein [Alphaproteobacteria bacterium]|nr:glycosyltransferase family 2 protein [Alphaproteobacteria bacterium]